MCRTELRRRRDMHRGRLRGAKCRRRRAGCVVPDGSVRRGARLRRGRLRAGTRAGRLLLVRCSVPLRIVLAWPVPLGRVTATTRLRVWLAGRVPHRCSGLHRRSVFTAADAGGALRLRGTVLRQHLRCGWRVPGHPPGRDRVRLERRMRRWPGVLGSRSGLVRGRRSYAVRYAGRTGGGLQQPSALRSRPPLSPRGDDPELRSDSATWRAVPGGPVRRRTVRACSGRRGALRCTVTAGRLHALAAPPGCARA